MKRAQELGHHRVWRRGHLVQPLPGTPGSPPSPLQETYKGTGANSEPETRAVAKAILAVKDAVRIYLSFHSYGELNYKI